MALGLESSHVRIGPMHAQASLPASAGGLDAEAGDRMVGIREDQLSLMRLRDAICMAGRASQGGFGQDGFEPGTCLASSLRMHQRTDCMRL